MNRVDGGGEVVSELIELSECLGDVHVAGLADPAQGAGRHVGGDVLDHAARAHQANGDLAVRVGLDRDGGGAIAVDQRRARGEQGDGSVGLLDGLRPDALADLAQQALALIHEVGGGRALGAGLGDLPVERGDAGQSIVDLAGHALRLAEQAGLRSGELARGVADAVGELAGGREGGAAHRGIARVLAERGHRSVEDRHAIGDRGHGGRGEDRLRVGDGRGARLGRALLARFGDGATGGEAIEDTADAGDSYAPERTIRRRGLDLRHPPHVAGSAGVGDVLTRDVERGGLRHHAVTRDIEYGEEGCHLGYPVT